MFDRRYIVSGVTGVAVFGTVAFASAFVGGKPGSYRIGFKNDEGAVPFLLDFRTLTVLGGVGINLVPVLAQHLGGVPVLGGTLRAVESVLGPTLQDYAALAATAAAVSLGATEALDMQESGEFMGMPVPAPILNFFKGSPADDAPALPAPDQDQEVALGADA